MYPSCCGISWKWIESTCCHTRYINFVFFFYFCLKIYLSSIVLCAISHITPCPPPPPSQKKQNKTNKRIIVVFSFSWGNCNTQKELTTKVMQNFGGHWRCTLGVVQINVNLLHQKYGCNHVVANFISPFTLYLWSCNSASALLQARVTLRRTLRDMARELSLSTGSLPSSTSDSLSTKSDQSHSLSSLSINGGKFSLVFCTVEYFAQTG